MTIFFRCRIGFVVASRSATKKGDKAEDDPAEFAGFAESDDSAFPPFLALGLGRLEGLGDGSEDTVERSLTMGGGEGDLTVGLVGGGGDSRERRRYRLNNIRIAWARTFPDRRGRANGAISG